MDNKKSAFLTDTDIIYLSETQIAENLYEYEVQMQIYNAGIKTVRSKLEILDEEFTLKYDHNPIHHIESRLKTPRSIVDKLRLKALPLTLDSIRTNLTDVAGIRVICNYIDDIYHLAELLSYQDDIQLIKTEDYIITPKQNGYRSLHLVIEIPIFLAEKTVNTPVEIQLRTIAMDFWASLEHELNYKNDSTITGGLSERLKKCADSISAVDTEMQDIHKQLLKR